MSHLGVFLSLAIGVKHNGCPPPPSTLSKICILKLPCQSHSSGLQRGQVTGPVRRIGAGTQCTVMPDHPEMQRRGIMGPLQAQRVALPMCPRDSASDMSHKENSCQVSCGQR